MADETRERCLSEIRRQVSDLSQKSGPGHAANVLRALVNLIPVGGGLIASLLTDYIPNSRDRNLQAFLQGLAEHVDNLSAVQQELIHTDEFVLLLTKGLRSVPSE